MNRIDWQGHTVPATKRYQKCGMWHRHLQRQLLLTMAAGAQGGGTPLQTITHWTVGSGSESCAAEVPSFKTENNASALGEPSFPVSQGPCLLIQDWLCKASLLTTPTPSPGGGGESGVPSVRPSVRPPPHRSCTSQPVSSPVWAVTATHRPRGVGTTTQGRSPNTQKTCLGAF